MDMALHDDPEPRIREMLAAHPLHPRVTGYDIRIEDLWDGEPGAWILLHTPSEVRLTKSEIQELVALQKDLIARLRKLAPGRGAYARYIVPPEASH